MSYCLDWHSGVISLGQGILDLNGQDQDAGDPLDKSSIAVRGLNGDFLWHFRAFQMLLSMQHCGELELRLLVEKMCVPTLGGSGLHGDLLQWRKNWSKSSCILLNTPVSDYAKSFRTCRGIPPLFRAVDAYSAP